MTSEAQSTDALLLVRPASFGFHLDAAKTNVFASPSNDPEVKNRAFREFDALARRLSDAGTEVIVLEDRPEPAKPDAIFPNNWVSFHADGTMVLYPMATEARRLERESERLASLLTSSGFVIRQVIDLSGHERHGRFLEGTGSLVLDRPRGRALASLSVRTDVDVIAEFDRALSYSTFVFEAHDRSGKPIYHTNVLLSFGSKFAILCRDAVAPEHRGRLLQEIEASGRALIEVDYEQLRKFACNLIELRSSGGEPLIAISSTALQSFRREQKRHLERFGQLVDASIPTIEAVGGGSVRCMIADIHLPRRT